MSFRSLSETPGFSSYILWACLNVSVIVVSRHRRICDAFGTIRTLKCFSRLIRIWIDRHAIRTDRSEQAEVMCPVLAIVFEYEMIRTTKRCALTENQSWYIIFEYFIKVITDFELLKVSNWWRTSRAFDSSAKEHDTDLETKRTFRIEVMVWARTEGVRFMEHHRNLIRILTYQTGLTYDDNVKRSVRSSLHTARSSNDKYLSLITISAKRVSSSLRKSLSWLEFANSFPEHESCCRRATHFWASSTSVSFYETPFHLKQSTHTASWSKSQARYDPLEDYLSLPALSSLAIVWKDTGKIERTRLRRESYFHEVFISVRFSKRLGTSRCRRVDVNRNHSRRIGQMKSIVASLIQRRRRSDRSWEREHVSWQIAHAKFTNIAELAETNNLEMSCCHWWSRGPFVTTVSAEDQDGRYQSNSDRR